MKVKKKWLRQVLRERDDALAEAARAYQRSADRDREWMAWVNTLTDVEGLRRPQFATDFLGGSVLRYSELTFPGPGGAKVIQPIIHDADAPLNMVYAGRTETEACGCVLLAGRVPPWRVFAVAGCPEGHRAGPVGP